jgi:queuine/archaeosine tRNA-ribosyltransferase
MVELEKKAIFVPAISTVISNLWKRSYRTQTHGEYDIAFFTPNSFFNYKYALTSTYYEIKNNVEDFRTEYKYPEDHVLISDSSGFQMATFARKNKIFDLSPLQILRWMEANADIAMNLDVPPWDNFNASLKASVENFNFFEINRLNFDMKLYNILHGKTLDEMKIWYHSVEGFESFNGWALGVRPANNVYLQVIGYLFLQEKGAKDFNTNFHMFGISGIKNMLVMAMLSNYFDSSITFDSSSYISGSRFKTFILPKYIRHSVDFGRSSTRGMKSIPCNCPVCSSLTIEELYLQEGTDSYTLIPLHNLYQYIEVNRMINCLITDDYAFTEYAKSVNEEETINTVNDMLAHYESHGCTSTYEKYKHLMTLRNTDTCASNISSFKPRVVI